MNRDDGSPRSSGRTRPDLILTAPPSDYIADHEMTSLLVRDACFAASCPNYVTRQWEPAPTLGRIPHLYFVDPLGRARPRRPPGRGRSVLVDVSRVFETKRQMLACHASQRDWLLRQHGIDEYLEMPGALGRPCAARRWASRRPRHSASTAAIPTPPTTSSADCSTSRDRPGPENPSRTVGSTVVGWVERSEAEGGPPRSPGGSRWASLPLDPPYATDHYPPRRSGVIRRSDRPGPRGHGVA